MTKKKRGRPRKTEEEMSDYTWRYGRERKKPVKHRAKQKDIRARRKKVKQKVRQGYSDREISIDSGWSEETIARDRRAQGIYRRKKRK